MSDKKLIGNQTSPASGYVLGNRGDFVGVPYTNGQDNSVFAYLSTGYYHIHGASFLYPKYANPVTLTSAAGVWAITGNKIEVIPANTIIKAFDIHWCSIAAISAEFYGVIDIFSGSAGNEVLIGSVDVVRTSAFAREGNAPVQIPQQPANTRISCRLSDNNASAQSVAVKFYGHVYSTSLT